MKLRLEWVVIVVLILIIIGSNIFYNIRYKELTNQFKQIVSGMSELKKVNEELWQKTQSDLNGIKDIKAQLSDFGKEMVKDKDLKGLFLAVSEIKEHINGIGEVNKEGKVSFKGEKNGFIYEGWTLYPSGDYDLKLGLKLKLEGYAREVRDGVYDTYLKVDNPNVKVENFEFKVLPKRKSLWDRLDLRLGLDYNIENGGGIQGLVGYSRYSLTGSVYMNKIYRIGFLYRIK